MNAAPMKLGTRASQLASRQSRWVADHVTAMTGRTVELVNITTEGDVKNQPLVSFGGTGVFATALREALLEGTCDFVVHSLKDLPTAPFPGLTLAAIPVRESAGDVLCASAPLADLSPGARIGTGSPRRAAQVRRARPDVTVVDIRGNVDTRLEKVRQGEYDGVILAAAGLHRLGRDNEIREEFALETWPSSAGQGALAIEARSDDASLRAELEPLNDPAARLRATLERRVLAGLEAGCAAPVGISATIFGAKLSIIAEVYSTTTIDSVAVRRSIPVNSLAGDDDQATFAESIVRELLASGAGAVADVGKQ